MGEAEMMPAVRLPADSKVRTPVDLKLKPNWRFDPNPRVFVSDSGEEFDPRGGLPRNSKIVYKMPHLIDADEARLSKHEKDLRRYMQVILPAGVSPAAYLEVVRTWPCAADAQVAPELSLPAHP